MDEMLPLMLRTGPIISPIGFLSKANSTKDFNMFPKPNEVITSSLLLQAPTIVYIYPHQIGPLSPISPDQIGVALTYQIAYQACANLLRAHGYHGSSSHDSHRNSGPGRHRLLVLLLLLFHEVITFRLWSPIPPISNIVDLFDVEGGHSSCS